LGIAHLAEREQNNNAAHGEIGAASRSTTRMYPLLFLCIAAVLARIATGLLLPNIAHPDETFQYLEQAYRLVAGRGLVPWEYEVGARSWLLAWLIWPAEAIGHALSHDPAVLRGSVVVFLALLWSGAVAAAYRIGLESAGPRAALFAGLLVAIWCELVYMANHMLADSISAVSLLATIAAGIRGPKASHRELFLAGLLGGLTIIIRPQLGPACALALLWTAGLRPRPRWIALGAGLLVPVALLGVTDWISWGAPFHSLRTYLYVNASGVANLFGVDPASYYLLREFEIWRLATPLMLVSAVAGTRRAPLLAIVALAVLVTFSAVPHKEWRFVFPALPILLALCGTGTAELIGWLERRTNERWRAGLPNAAALLWIVLSLLSGLGGTMRAYWTDESGIIRAFDRASADPAACGVAIDPADHWEKTGMVRLRGGLMLYGATPDSIEHYNYIVSANDPGDPARLRPFGYRRVACYHQQVCLYRRAGSCTPGTELAAHPGPQVADLLRKLGTR